MLQVIIAMLLSLAATFALGGTQDISEAVHVIDLNSPLPPIDPSLVKVYTYKPSGNVKFIGKIRARGMASVDKPGPLDVIGLLLEAASPTNATEEDDKRLAMQALLKDAGSIGANGLIITSSIQVQTSNNSSERRIEAFALHVSSDEMQPGGGACSTSPSCEQGKYCRMRQCQSMPQTHTRPDPYPSWDSVPEGGLCYGDEHCTKPLLCSPSTGRCSR